MKILLVHNRYQQPGGEDVVFEQEHALLQRNGHSVVTYTRTNCEVKAYHGLSQIQLAKNTIWSTDSRRSFSEVLGREKPDLVHVHNTFMLISPSIFAACREHHIPVVQTLHNYRMFCPAATFFRDGHVCEECVHHGLWRSMMYGCYRNSRPATATVALMLAANRRWRTWSDGIDAYIALTQFAKRKFVESGLPADRIFVKPNFVHPDIERLADGSGGYALFVGRLSPEKSVTTVLSAWRKLNAIIPLLIIGGGSELAALERDAARLGLSKVRFCGHVSRVETLEAMRGARFLVFSSEWFENFPVTLAESFACGLPVIAARRGVIPEIVQDGATGVHFRPGDPGDLASKVIWAWEHPRILKEMAAAARKEYLAKYTAEANYPLLMNIYRSAMTRSYWPETDETELLTDAGLADGSAFSRAH